VSIDGILSGLEHLNGQMLAGETEVAKLALDPLDNLHHSVIGLERVRLSFELMLAVRNKVLDAYQELMRMQV
jgi:flagellar hook-basal body complex protein FliE